MKKNGFTIIELIAVLVIIVIIFLSATILVKKIVDKTRENARKRSIDAYGRAVELAASEYLLDNGSKVNDINLLNVKYSGDPVACDINVVYQNMAFLSKCTVDGVIVKDKRSMDGYYQYGDIIKFGDFYSEKVKKSIEKYKLQNAGLIPLSINDLELNLDNFNFSCDFKKINSDGSYYLSKCNLGGVDIYSKNSSDGYYHWGGLKYYVGDVVRYNNIDFFVIENSDDSMETVHLLKKEPIKNKELEDSLDEIGLNDKIEINNSEDYLKTKYCYRGTCSYNYNNSDLKKIVDLWESKYINSDDLKKDNSGYMIRVLNDTDVFQNLQYHIGNMQYAAHDGGGTVMHYTTNLDFDFPGIWCTARINDSNYSVTALYNNFMYSANIKYDNSYGGNGDVLYVSPVINIKKIVLAS